uniref:Uncharacterized protein n=1 Tax=Octopus bimaculoides TaxID=37653 RepID=A0A0L8IDJ2_OCTBM
MDKTGFINECIVLSSYLDRYCYYKTLTLFLATTALHSIAYNHRRLHTENVFIDYCNFVLY